MIKIADAISQLRRMAMKKNRGLYKNLGHQARTDAVRKDLINKKYIENQEDIPDNVKRGLYPKGGMLYRGQIGKRKDGEHWSPRLNVAYDYGNHPEGSLSEIKSPPGTKFYPQGYALNKSHKLSEFNKEFLKKRPNPEFRRAETGADISEVPTNRHLKETILKNQTGNEFKRVPGKQTGSHRFIDAKGRILATTESFRTTKLFRPNS